MSNAYFQLIIGKSETWLKLIPATQGGESLEFSELTEYLELHKINYDLKKLYEVVERSGEEQMICLNSDTCMEERESYRFSLEEDGMKAVVRFYAPSEGGELMTREEFLKDLEYRGVVQGIDYQEIDRFFSDREYCTDYIVAKGTLPQEGKNCIVQYYFNTDLKAKPTVNEDGSVDFFHLNTINPCKAGDMLAKLIPAVPGIPGVDVTGRAIPPREVKNSRLHFGRNISYREEEDGSSAIYSEVNGHVTLIGSDVFVSDVMEVENVDTATGNIEYNGSVQVNGNVCSNFSIKAKGNVDVRGVVEGATIEAGGNIIIARGMNGMGKGYLKAGGNVVAKFLESATVEAEGNVTCNSIMHSVVTSRGEVNVEGRKGFIAGGKISASKKISVKNLGSPMGADTIVEVGTDPHVKQRFQELNQKVNEADKVIRSLDPILQSFDEKIHRGIRLSSNEVKYLESLIRLRKIKKLNMESAMRELEPLKEKLKTRKDASVVVSGEVYQGTRVSVSDVSMVVQDTIKACKFVYFEGNVKAEGLY